ncbi:hypothetical protein U1Q18_037276 [Sarracenia purpurea var. burkii]
MVFDPAAIASRSLVVVAVHRRSSSVVPPLSLLFVEHSAAAAAEESSANLSELVDSFLDRDSGVEDDFCKDAESEEESNRNESESYCTDFEMKKMLLSLMEARGMTTE